MKKKLMLKITKYISENRRKVNKVPIPSANYFRQGSIKLRKGFANYNPLRKESDELDKYSIESSNYYDNTKKVINLCKNQKNEDKNDIMEKIDKYKEKINKDNFIFIFKLMLFIIIILILIIYILNMILQRHYINMTEKILLTFYYNAKTKNIILNIFSKLLGSFIDISGLTSISLSETYQASILYYAKELRKYYHDFNKNYIEYNIDMKKSFQLIYNSHKFYKLRGKWKEVLYDSEYCS